MCIRHSVRRLLLRHGLVLGILYWHGRVVYRVHLRGIVVDVVDIAKPIWGQLAAVTHMVCQFGNLKHKETRTEQSETASSRTGVFMRLIEQVRRHVK